TERLQPPLARAEGLLARRLYERPSPTVRLQHSPTLQLPVHPRYGVRVHPEIHGELPHRGKLVASKERPRSDGELDLFGDLRMQRHRAPRVDGEPQRHSTIVLIH